MQTTMHHAFQWDTPNVSMTNVGDVGHANLSGPFDMIHSSPKTTCLCLMVVFVYCWSVDLALYVRAHEADIDADLLIKLITALRSKGLTVSGVWQTQAALTSVGQHILSAELADTSSFDISGA